MARSAASGRVAQAVKKIDRTSAGVKKSQANSSKASVVAKTVRKTTPESLAIVVKLFKAQGVATYVRGKNEYLDQPRRAMNASLLTGRQDVLCDQETLMTSSMLSNTPRTWVYLSP
jgi:hypothetical protein